MSEQLPAPDFDSARYERPQCAWICGRLEEGQPCSAGPSPEGRCRVGPECAPRLEKRPGEEKGLWHCTRRPERGGPCAEGPRPDGSCSQCRPPCSPRRSLRRLRGQVSLGFSALLLGGLLLILAGPTGWRFINPGPISRPHQSRAFHELAGARLSAETECAACHLAARGGLMDWLQRAGRSMSTPEILASFAHTAPGPRPMTSLDRQACVVCHQRHEFHQPNVSTSASCSECHQEHRGLQLAAPTDARCADCHGSPLLMAAASAQGAALESRLFDPPLPPSVRVFESLRPPGGRTNVFRSFWEGHPDFGILVSGRKDSSALHFNHALHLGETVRDEGRTLVCASCHVPDPDGTYFDRISYHEHCRRCHTLQFDPLNPTLTLPHGDVAAARAMLRGLPLMYAELARRQGLTRREDTDRFAQTNLARMRATLGSGEALEQLVFFTQEPQPTPATAGSRAYYSGCALCHEVRPDPQQFALITPVAIPDRWLRAGRFSHQKHAQTQCEECHSSRTSRESTDISLPSQTTCIVCHSPRGGVPSGCAVCHSYHLGAGANR